MKYHYDSYCTTLDNNDMPTTELHSNNNGSPFLHHQVGDNVLANQESGNDNEGDGPCKGDVGDLFGINQTRTNDFIVFERQEHTCSRQPTQVRMNEYCELQSVINHQGALSYANTNQRYTSYHEPHAINYNSNLYQPHQTFDQLQDHLSAQPQQPAPVSGNENLDAAQTTGTVIQDGDDHTDALVIYHRQQQQPSEGHSCAVANEASLSDHTATAGAYYELTANGNSNNYNENQQQHLHSELTGRVDRQPTVAVDHQQHTYGPRAISDTFPSVIQQPQQQHDQEHHLLSDQQHHYINQQPPFAIGFDAGEPVYPRPADQVQIDQPAMGYSMDTLHNGYSHLCAQIDPGQPHAMPLADHSHGHDFSDGRLQDCAQPEHTYQPAESGILQQLEATTTNAANINNGKSDSAETLSLARTNARMTNDHDDDYLRRLSATAACNKQQQQRAFRPRKAPSSSSSSSSYSESESSMSSTMTRDEKKAREANIPMSWYEIVNLSIEQFNEKLAQFTLSESQLTLIKDIRRRGKNKVAAQSCRKRKMEQIFELQQEVENLVDKKNALIYERQQLLREHTSLVQRYDRIQAAMRQHLHQVNNALDQYQ